ncbi:MAG: hypothetical protein AAFX62_02815 [Pseudomonadota bacterium]
MTPSETLTLLDAVSMPVLNGSGTVPGSVDALIADATLMTQASGLIAQLEAGDGSRFFAL